MSLDYNLSYPEFREAMVGDEIYTESEEDFLNTTIPFTHSKSRDVNPYELLCLGKKIMITIDPTILKNRELSDLDETYEGKFEQVSDIAALFGIELEEKTDSREGLYDVKYIMLDIMKEIADDITPEGYKKKLHYRSGFFRFLETEVKQLFGDQPALLFGGTIKEPDRKPSDYDMHIYLHEKPDYADFQDFLEKYRSMNLDEGIIRQYNLIPKEYIDAIILSSAESIMDPGHSLLINGKSIRYPLSGNKIKSRLNRIDLAMVLKYARESVSDEWIKKWYKVQNKVMNRIKSTKIIVERLSDLGVKHTPIDIERPVFDFNEVREALIRTNYWNYRLFHTHSDIISTE